MQNHRLKPGLAFLKTPSGAVLMDVAANRFYSLSPISATIWSQLSNGDAANAVREVSRLKDVSLSLAEEIYKAQTRTWKRAGLIDADDLPKHLPQQRTSPPAAVCEFPAEIVRSARLSPYLMASLRLTEVRYQNLLRRIGFAETLCRLQSEGGIRARLTSSLSATEERFVGRLLRNYYALRRAFRQSMHARDCLPRSLTLSALLRRNGLEAVVCIGIQDLPFQSHAWVEVNGNVINEARCTYERYQVIARF